MTGYVTAIRIIQIDPAHNENNPPTFNKKGCPLPGSLIDQCFELFFLFRRTLHLLHFLRLLFCFALEQQLDEEINANAQRDQEDFWK